MTGTKLGTGRAALLLALIGVGAMPLAGCDSFNRAIGKTRVIPDEFQVVSNAPLAIPPDYTLRPPRVGATDQSTLDQARESVFRVGDQQQANLPAAQAGRSLGEADLLREAGAAKAPQDIRKMVDTDPKEGVPFERSLVDKLVFWEGPKTPPSAAVINPSEENTRLRLAQNVAKPGSTPATPGDAGTPTFERTTNKKSSWFGWLF
jgi:hypothetical protein